MKSSRNIFYVLLLASTNFFSFIPYRKLPYGHYILELSGYMFFIWMFDAIRNYRKYLFGKEMVFILFSFLLSTISSNWLFGQSFVQSLQALGPYVFAIMIYFYLNKSNFDESKLKKFIIYSGCVFSLILIIQQYTYPHYIFNGTPPSELTGLLEQRMGLWRFVIMGICYCELALFIAEENLLSKKISIQMIIVLALTLLGVYFFTFRKTIYLSIFCFFLGFILNLKKTRLLPFLLLTIIGVLLITLLPEYLGEMNEETYDQLNDNDFIRYLATDYFANKFSNSPLYIIFGSSIPFADSSLGLKIHKLAVDYGYWQVDCGVVGYFSRFGIFGVLCQLLVLTKLVRYFKYLSIYLKLYLILIVSLSAFTFWGNEIPDICAFSVFLYLSENSIKKNRQKIKMNVTKGRKGKKTYQLKNSPII